MVHVSCHPYLTVCVDLGVLKGLGSSEDPSDGLDWRFFPEILLSV